MLINVIMVLTHYPHIILLLLLSFYECSCSNNAEFESNLHRTNKNNNMKSENTYENVNEPGKISQTNYSSNENDLKDIAPMWPNRLNSTTVMQGFTIFFGLSLAIVLYFIIKAIRLRRRRYRVRKYGLLTSREDVEMTPLGEEEEDEESTVFDINDHPRSTRT